MKKILLAGATGFIGKHLTGYLSEKGFELSVLTRRALIQKPKMKYFKWDVEKGFIDDKAFENIDTLINLTGANINAKRWTPKRKKEIVNSRVKSLDLLFEKVSQLQIPLKTLISSSAVGYYGAVSGHQVFEETSDSGTDFLASVCRRWENAAMPFKQTGARVIILRKGVVLGRDGGIYKKMAPLARWGINPAVGSGKQCLPWIDIRDLARMYFFLLQNQKIEGIFNAVASEQITMNDFAQELLRSFGRKSILPPVPSFLIKLVFGESACMLLEGSRVSNQKIKGLGFEFMYDTLKEVNL